MVIAAKEITIDRTNLLDRLTSLCKERYGARLISLVVFGSVGRGTPRPDSDIDLLLVIKDLPNGRIARVKEFVPIEIVLGDAIKTHFDLSPVFKTPRKSRTAVYYYWTWSKMAAYCLTAMISSSAP